MHGDSIQIMPPLEQVSCRVHMRNLYVWLVA